MTSVIGLGLLYMREKATDLETTLVKRHTFNLLTVENSLYCKIFLSWLESYSLRDVDNWGIRAKPLKIFQLPHPVNQR